MLFTVIRGPAWPQTALCRITDRMGPRTIEWGGGSFCGWNRDTEIVEQFEAADWDAAELCHIRKYWKLEATKKPVGGWMSPDGKLYEASYGHHADLAVIIGAHLFNTVDFGGYSLEKRGWHKFDSNGICYTARHYDSFTQAQMDALEDLKTHPEASKEYRENIDWK